MLTGELSVDLKINLSKIKSDFIIVGQGFAGSVLAVMLINKGFKIHVIDAPELSSCSKVGGGGINPVVFKRLTKSWMADEILPVMNTFYSECEKLFNCTLVVPRNVVKLFTEEQEVALWMQKASGEMHNYLESKIYSVSEFKGIKINAAGYAKVKSAAGFIMPDFLAGAKKYIQENGCLTEENFDYAQLLVNEQVVYKEHESGKIIFAEGYCIKNNPFFNYLPFKPVKGEILTITSDEIDLGNNIIKKNVFLAHMYGKVYKTGSTYNWTNLNDHPTTEGREEIESKLRKITDAAYTVIQQEAGVRPSVIDRRPVLGVHPVCKNMLVFNGLGAKGVMLGPYFANELINHLIKGSELNKEVNVERFRQYFVN